MTTATIDTLTNKIARGMAAHLFAFVQKPGTDVWADGVESVEALECSPGHIQFRVYFRNGESSTDIGTSNTSVAGIRELGRLAASIIEDNRSVKQFREETVNGTVAGCDVSIEFFEENGEQRACAYIERNGYSASLEWAEGEGYLTGTDGERPIGASIVAKVRRWADARGY